MPVAVTQEAGEPKPAHQEIRAAVRHTAVYGLGSVLAKAIGFLLLPLYTRYLSPDDYGVLEILDLTMSLIGMFMNMGMTASVLRYYNNAPSAEAKRRVISTAFWFVTVTGALLWLAAMVAARPLSTLLFNANVPSGYFLLSFTSFTLGYIINIPSTYVQAKEKSGVLVIADTVCLGSLLGLNIYFVVFLKIGLAGILLSPLITGALRILVFGVWTVRNNGLGFEWPRLREMLRFGAPLVLSNLAMFTLNFSDRFFLKQFGSLGEVGVYSVAYKFGFMLNLAIIQPFCLMWQVRMYIIDKLEDRSEVFQRIFILYAALLVFAALCLSVMSPEIVRLMLDRRFAAAGSVIPVIACAYVVYGVGYFFQTGLLMSGRTTAIGALSAAAASGNLALNFWLVRRYGMQGAAWATVLGILIIAIGSCVCSWREFTRRLDVHRFLGTAAIGAGLYWISTIAGTGPAGASLLIKCGFLASFPLLIVVTKCLSPGEVELILLAQRTLLRRGAERFGFKRAEAI
jgi:O-antigen/teichoic acid export membrane protein